MSTPTPDSLSPQEAYAAAGLVVALSNMHRSIWISAQKYTGVRTELQISPGEASQGGFHVAKVFTILIPKGQFAQDPKNGCEVLDDLGRKFKLERFVSDAIQYTLYCFSTYA